ncbi:MAG: TonB-dependent receptor, partial [Rhodoferax sp.]|nr:TonB-dependent receptor [Rhodoferax sp.]
VERIEVLRGPAALLYGGSAVGGVVNVIDNRIPGLPLPPFSGAAELRLGGAANERSVAALVEGGSERLALHADVFKRRTHDLQVPAFVRPGEDGGSTRSRHVVNSASDAEGGAVGGAWLWQGGHLGLSLDTYRNRYGTVAEVDVTIGMQRDRLALAGEATLTDGAFATVRGQLAWTDYRHTEFEGDEVGTVFRNQGHDGRLEVVQRPLRLGGGVLDCVAGLQLERADFVADGEEAFVPATQSRMAGVFLVERWRLGGTLLSAGLRRESVRVRSDGDAVDSDEPRFGAPTSRRFSPAMASLGLTRTLAEGWELGAHLAHTERAPTSYELYANGVHVATAAFERGDPDQPLERGRHAELSLAWRQGAHELKATAFHSRFDRYIALLPTGESSADEDGGDVPVLAFEGVPATLRGMEFEGRWRVLDGVWRLDLGGQADLLEGDNRRDRQPLPRIAPHRLTLTADLRHGAWGAQMRWRHAARQGRVAADDTATAAWSMWDLALTWQTQTAHGNVLWFLRGTNLGDTLAYNAATTATLRPLSPLPGRSLQSGLQWRW